MARTKKTEEKNTALLEAQPAEEQLNADEPQKADEPPKTEDKAEDKAEDVSSNIIEPVAVSVRLREIHPQASYGRIGRRFTKLEAVEIAFNELSTDEHIALEQDPWLEVIYLTEK